MHPVVVAFVFVFVWFGVLLYIGGDGIIAGVTELISGSGPEASDLVGLFIPAMMLIFGIVILLAARYLAAGERRKLTDFVRAERRSNGLPR